MSDEQEQQEEQDQGSPSAGTPNTENMIPKSRFDEVNRRMKKAEKSLEDLQQARAQQEEAALAEQNKYKELYEKAKAENEALRTKAEQAEALQAAIADGNAKRIEQLPEALRALVPDYDDPVKTQAWLDANAATLTAGKLPAPSLNGGAGQPERPSQSLKLTPLEEKIAAASGMTPEEYVQFRDRTAAPRGEHIALLETDKKEQQ